MHAKRYHFYKDIINCNASEIYQASIFFSINGILRGECKFPHAGKNYPIRKFLRQKMHL